LQVDVSVWDQLTYCYEDIRCPLYHQASDMTVTDAMLDDFVDTVTYLINEMFGIDAGSIMVQAATEVDAESSAPKGGEGIDLSILSKVDAIVLSVGREPAKDSASILSHLRSLGITAKLTTNAVSAYLSQGKYFHKDPQDGLWKLTEFVGRRRFREITEVSR